MKRQQPRALRYDGESVRQFLKGFHADATREAYSKKLFQFAEFCGMTPDELLAETNRDPKSFHRLIVDYIERRKPEVSGSTIGLTVASLKHFFEMNDADQAVNWAKVSKLVPRARKTGSDRAPTTEEIRQMVQAADIRTRCIILMCVSSGIRVGAFEGMCWGDLTPIYKEEDGDGKAPAQIRAARLVVYRGSVEEYITFVSPECYDSLMQYRGLREGIGETITARSPLIRDAWDNHRYRKQVAKDPKAAKPLTSKTIANMMGQFLKRIRLRDPSLCLPAGGGNGSYGNHYEFKQVHGFRKYFKTNAERTIKTIDVEKLIGHAESYYKPSEEYLAEQYAKIVPNLTISETAELKGQDAKAGRGQRQEGGRDRAQERGAAGQAEQAGVKLRLAEGHPGGRHPGEDQAARMSGSRRPPLRPAPTAPCRQMSPVGRVSGHALQDAGKDAYEAALSRDGGSPVPALFKYGDLWSNNDLLCRHRKNLENVLKHIMIAWPQITRTRRLNKRAFHTSRLYQRNVRVFQIFAKEQHLGTFALVISSVK